MAFSDAAMIVAANAVRTAITHAQLHRAAAGGSGTSNLTTAARVAITWAAATGAGNFDLASPLEFTGIAANGPVYSVTYWSASSGGTFYGEDILTGDATANSSGEYTVTSLAQNGSST